MYVLDDLSKAEPRQETILTIGSFDGVHRGHQALIGQVVDRGRATGCQAAVVTFHPHPAAVLGPDRAPPMLTAPREKLALFEELGVDLVVLLPFTGELASTPARLFAEALRNRLLMRELWVGQDFALGYRRDGDIPRLRQLGEEQGFAVHIITPSRMKTDGMAVISSSHIRTTLEAGDVRRAASLLGRYPSLSGRVVVGAQRGRTLGFPTANLEVRPERAVPANGVYAVFAVLGRERLAGVANMGIRPSFDNGQRIVETHILDFDRDIYGCDLVIEFVERLRNERRFEDISDLVTQIQADSEEARSILEREMGMSGGEGRPRDVETSRVGTATRRDARITAATGRGEDRPGTVGCRHRIVEVEHTADRAIWVSGERLPDLFVGAARGMYSLMCDLDSFVPVEWREVRLEALDQESLLVEWLNELLFITETDGLLAAEARIDDLSTTALSARVGVAGGEVTRSQIKAATFHNLAIQEDGSGWSTVITFDV